MTRLVLLLSLFWHSTAFAPTPPSQTTRTTRTTLHATDPVSYLRTEWVSAALITNQTPRSADTVLQLGSFDGRIVNFVPRTVRTIITSSAEDVSSPEGGGLSVSTERQLKQAVERRACARVQYSNQRADKLIDTPSSSVDVVVMFQSVQRMVENGVNWKMAIREGGRVLKPGGRFLFVECAEVGDGESFLEEVMRYCEMPLMMEEGDDETEQGKENEGEIDNDDDSNNNEDNKNESPSKIFSEVGFDNVDLVLQPHVAGVAIKALDADLTSQQKAAKKNQEEQDRLADLSLSAFERGSKRRKRKKGKKGVENEELGMKSAGN